MDTVVVVVEFAYTVETLTEPVALLPGLEEDLQEIVAANLLFYCLDDDRELRKVNHNVKKRRHLNQRRRLATTAVSSTPTDVVSGKSIYVLSLRLWSKHDLTMNIFPNHHFFQRNVFAY